MAHLASAFKLLAFAVLGLLAAVLVLCLSPLALVYFLFDRLCSLIEEFRPARKKKGWGERLARIQQFLKFIPLKK